MLTGLWLFSVTTEYLTNPAFLTKMALLTVAIGSIALLREDRVYAPTLSELIRSCGSGFFSLHRDDDIAGSAVHKGAE